MGYGRACVLFLSLGATLAACQGGESAPSKAPGSVAATCAVDAECEPGLVCIDPGANDPVFGGGPANGYCSKSCSAHEDCSDDFSVLCVSDADGVGGVCVLTCTIGPALRHLNDALDPQKCNGREDLRCKTASLNASLCLPTCGDDSQCPPGRVCDPRTAVCVDSPNTGEPMGAPCDPEAVMTECAGACALFADGVTACTSPCVLGGNNGPNPTSNCGGPRRGYCIYSTLDSGAGDEGGCAPACTTQDDCQAPALWCAAIAGLTGTHVENGYCGFADACPGGQHDCRREADRCTPTRFGPFCLNPTFPLGSAAPEGAPRN